MTTKQQNVLRALALKVLQLELDFGATGIGRFSCEYGHELPHLGISIDEAYAWATAELEGNLAEAHDEIARMAVNHTVEVVEEVP